MAHDLTPEDLLQPSGQLTASLFPAPQVADDVIEAWLDQANAEELTNIPTELHDDAARQYVYWRAYDAQADRIGNRPDRENNFNDVERAWGENRLRYWQGKAATARGLLDAMRDTATALPAGQIASSSSARLRVVF